MKIFLKNNWLQIFASLALLALIFNPVLLGIHLYFHPAKIFTLIVIWLNDAGETIAKMLLSML